MNNIDYSNFAMFDTLRAVADLLAQQTSGELAFRFCEFSGQVKSDNGPLQDTDVLRATYLLEREYRWAKQPPSSRRVFEAIQLAARENSSHPVKHYLNRCAHTWDGKPRAHELFAGYFGACDSELRQVQSKAFLVSAVARVMQPGCKVDTMPVLISPQGWGKSTAIRTLSVYDTWFRDTPLDLRSKDCYEALQGCWIIEIAEMRSIVSSRPETVKAFLTSQVDSYRPAYGRCNVYRPRQCVFIGTSNDLQLSDTTGNRRYWPIPLENKPRWDGLEHDRDQLWGEAVALWRDGFQWYLTTDKLIELAAEEVEIYCSSDPWEASIEKFWAQGWVDRSGGIMEIMHHPRTPFEATTLLSFLGIDRAKQRQSDVMRLARLMRGLGYTSKRERVNGKRRTYWKGQTGHAGQAI